MSSQKRRNRVAPTSGSPSMGRMDSRMTQTSGSLKLKATAAEERVTCEDHCMESIVQFCQKLFPIWLINYFSNQVRDGLPFSMFVKDVRKLPKFWLYFIGISYALSFWALTIYFTWITYVGGRTSPFVSLSMNGGDCKEVPKAVSSSFLISVGDDGMQGFWETNPGFNFNSTAFSLKLVSYQATSALFQDTMDLITQEMVRLGDMMAQRDFAFNLIILSTFGKTFVTTESGELSFKAMGDVATIYDRIHSIGAFSSSNNLCHYPTTIEYNSESSVYSVELTDYGARSADVEDSCTKAFTPEELGYDATYNKNNFYMKLDMRAFSVAISINSGILTISELSGVLGTSNTFVVDTGNGNTISGKVSGYYDPFLPGMDLVYCVTYDEATLAGVGGTGVYCLVDMAGSSFAVPLTNSFGTKNFTSQENPDPERVDFTSSYCDCNSPYFHQDSGCGEMDIMPAWVFFKDDLNHAKLMNFTYYAYVNSVMQPDGDIYLSKLAYPAIALSIYDLEYNYSAFYHDVHYKNAFADFCNNCSIFALNVFDEFDNLNPFYFGVVGGSACKNTIYHGSMMEELAEHPPLLFTENYFECVMTIFDSLFQAAGLALGNAPMILVVQYLVIMLVLSIFLRTCRGFKDNITDFEEDDVFKEEEDGKFDTVIKIVSSMNSSRIQDCSVRDKLDKFLIDNNTSVQLSVESTDTEIKDSKGVDSPEIPQVEVDAVTSFSPAIKPKGNANDAEVEALRMKVDKLTSVVKVLVTVIQDQSKSYDYVDSLINELEDQNRDEDNLDSPILDELL